MKSQRTPTCSDELAQILKTPLWSDIPSTAGLQGVRVPGGVFLRTLDSHVNVFIPVAELVRDMAIKMKYEAKDGRSND